MRRSFQGTAMQEFDLSQISKAAERLRPYVTRTPVLTSPMLDAAAGCSVFVKAESLQKTGSFKIRGALNKMLSMPDELLQRGVITYSAGNHGQAVAAGAKLVGCKSVIVLPDNAPTIKVENCRWWGAEIVLYNPQTQDRADVVDRIVAERGMTFISPFDDFDVMAGQGTAGLELCEQLEALEVVPDVLIVNCSGGGLSSGVITAVKAKFPDVEACIVEAAGFEKMAAYLESGTPERIKGSPVTIMDGIAGPATGAKTLSVLKRHGVRCLSVADDDAIGAMNAAFRWLKLVLEPGGAASLAAVFKYRGQLAGRNVAIVSSGGNVDPGVFAKSLS
jgi:threonine dehydratase